MRRATASWLLAGLALSLGWAQACASSTGQPPPSAPKVPFQKVVAAPAATPESSPSVADSLELGDFAPLLSLPELAEVARAADREQPAQAATRLGEVLERTAPTGLAAARMHYLMGTLQERAGLLDDALVSYEKSAAQPWDLSPYVAVARARVTLARGDAAQALRHLESVPAGLVVAEAVHLLRGRAAERTGDHDLAIANYRAYLTRQGREPEHVSVSLRLAAELLARAGANTSTASDDRAEALVWARRASWASTDAAERQAAAQLEQRALAGMSARDRRQHQSLSTDDQLGVLQELVDSRRFTDAEIVAQGLLAGLTREQRFGEAGCEAQLLRAKALAGSREWGKAVDFLSDTLRSCRHGDQLARGLYIAGKYAMADKRYAAATRFFEQLEKDAPTHRLADDARVMGAQSHLEMGAEARYTQLLSTIAEDYPRGDVVLDGVFSLAMKRIEKGDWSGAASVLDGAADLAAGQDQLRGTEFSGRERYFRARAWMQIGEKDRALDQYERIVRELPLSYYMLHAYTRLKREDAARAEAARGQAIAMASEQPFSFRHQPVFDTPGFRRALELLRQGDVAFAESELRALGLLGEDVAPSLLWAVALLYDRAGAAQMSHRIARGLLTDWLQRWPAGDWRRAWELAFPRPHADVVESQARKNDVSQALIYGVMREESQFDPKVVSHAGAYGLMQLMPATAKHYAAKANVPYSKAALVNPKHNIALGAVVLESFTRPFRENPLLCIPAYNAGPGRPKRWLREHPNADFDVWVELIPFRETRRYTHRVIAARAAYGYLYGEDAGSDSWLTLPIAFNK